MPFPRVDLPIDLPQRIRDIDAEKINAAATWLQVAATEAATMLMSIQQRGLTITVPYLGKVKIEITPEK